MISKLSVYKSIILVFIYLIATIPRSINYQGKITDSLGIGINDTLQITFRLFLEDTSEIPLWTQIISDVAISKGLFSVELSSFPDSVDFSAAYWIEVEIDDEVISPRKKLDTSPYSFRAIYSDTTNYIDGVILDQDSTAQDANFWIEGKGSANFLRIIPNMASTESPQTGDIRTTGSGVNFTMLAYDGICWRRFYPPIPHPSDCYGTPLLIEAEDSISLCEDDSIDLAVEVSGGFPPYEYNWNDTGWDSSSTFNVTSAGDYTVYARDIIHELSDTAVITVFVINLSATPVANNGSDPTTESFQANWEASLGATGYLLDVSTLNDFSTFVPGYNDLDVGNVTSYTVSGLSSGITYYYRVRAYNTCERSGYSETISYNTVISTCESTGGWEYNDYCWFEPSTSTLGTSCDEICASYGQSCVNARAEALDESIQCTICQHFHPTASCTHDCNNVEPAWEESSNSCKACSNTYSTWCSKTWIEGTRYHRRQCSCTF